MRYHYKTGAAMAADLKAAAHRVRQTIDALPITTHPETGRPVNPRKARLCDMANYVASGGEGKRYQMPYLSPRARHALAVR